MALAMHVQVYGGSSSNLLHPSRSFASLVASRMFSPLFLAIFNDHVQPSLLRPSAASLSLHVSIECDLRVSIVAHTCDMSEIAQSTLLELFYNVLLSVQSPSNVHVFDAISS